MRRTGKYKRRNRCYVYLMDSEYRAVKRYAREHNLSVSRLIRELLRDVCTS